MADFIKVDTNAVNMAAAKIETYNNTIKNDFSSVEAAIRSLNSTWHGSAAGCAINSFGSIKTAYFNARYDVMDNFVKFLRQVDAGYTQTEAARRSHADMFK